MVTTSRPHVTFFTRPFKKAIGNQQTANPLYLTAIVCIYFFLLLFYTPQSKSDAHRMKFRVPKQVKDNNQKKDFPQTFKRVLSVYRNERRMALAQIKIDPGATFQSCARWDRHCGCLYFRSNFLSRLMFPPRRQQIQK